MNFDERMERLGERLDGMAMNMTLQQRQFEDRFARIDKTFDTTARTFESALDSIVRLENTAASHEHRLDNLENPPRL